MAKQNPASAWVLEGRLHGEKELGSLLDLHIHPH